MKNEKEMLNLFQVEELEKRYEMGKWTVKASATYSQSSGASATASGSYSW